MYENIYEMMVEAGIAEEKKGKRFSTKQSALHILYSPNQNTYSL
jgi:hypothetical protein